MKLSQYARALTGGIVWVCIGGFLIYRGLFPYWGLTAEKAPGWLYPALAIGVVVGAAKGFFVLRKSCIRMIARIEAHPAPVPVWQLYPVYLYLLIPLMMGLGFFLKSQYGDEYPSLILGLYTGIGAALLTSSIPFFASLKRF